MTCITCNSNCNCANSCGCNNPTPTCEDLNLDADNSWIYVTTDTDCGTRVDKVSLRCLKTFLATIIINTETV